VESFENTEISLGDKPDNGTLETITRTVFQKMFMTKKVLHKEPF